MPTKSQETAFVDILNRFTGSYAKVIMTKSGPERMVMFGKFDFSTHQDAGVFFKVENQIGQCVVFAEFTTEQIQSITLHNPLSHNFKGFVDLTIEVQP